MHYLLAFSLAVLSVSFFPEIPSNTILFIAAIVAIVCFCLNYRWLSIVIIGTVIGCCLANYKITQQLPHELEKKSLTIVGTIVGIPIVNTSNYDKNRQRFTFYIDHVYDQHVSNNQIKSHKINSQLQKKTIQLSWYQNAIHSKSQNTQSAHNLHIPELKTGQCWMFTVKLRRPRGFVNPAGFDYQAFLLRKGIYATGYIQNSKSQRHTNQIQKSNLCKKNAIQGIADKLRWFVFQKLQQIDNPETKGPLLALSIGDTQWMTGKQWEQLYSTGTIHLFAISGLHIGLAAAIGFYSGLFLMKLIAILSPAFIGQHIIPPVFSIAIAGFYALLAGMSLPTQRAFIMVLLFHLCRLCYRRLPVGYLFCSALCWIALTDPLAMTSAGFWLSFLAVAVLLYGFQGRQWTQGSFVRRYISDLLKTQWLLFPGLALVSIVWMQGLSVSAPLANIFAVSLVSLLVVPLLFVWLFLSFAQLPGDQSLLLLLEWCIECLWLGLSLFEQYAPGFWFPSVVEPRWYSLLLGAIGVLWLLAPRGVPYRYWGLLGFLPLLFPLNEEKGLSITFLDVGQGTAVAVRTSNHTLVYDTGPRYSERFNAGQHIILPYLRSQGLTSIQQLMVSHSDYDHAGGLNGLVEHFPVETVTSGQPEVIRQRLGSSHNVKGCYAGQHWVWDNVAFTVLWPDPDAISLVPDNNNNASCVLLIEYQGQKILLAGDIDKHVERWLLKHAASQLQDVDVLLVPHHGSRTSSSPLWVNTLLPQWGIMSAGYRNRYHHPHIQVTSRYLVSGTELLSTAYDGAIRFTWETQGYCGEAQGYCSEAQGYWGKAQGYWDIERWREDYRRYWYSSYR